MQQWEFHPSLIYSFLTVSLSPGPVEHNDWTPLHGQQGFSWKPGTVSFGTIDSDGDPAAYVELSDTYFVPDEAIISIKVPFEVSKDGIIVADPIFNEWVFPVPQGYYALYFTIEPLSESWKYRLTFVPQSSMPKAEILRATAPYISPPSQLLME